MATKSFLKNVSLRGTRQCREFIRALEKSEKQTKPDAESAAPVHDMTREQIRKVFGTGNE